MSIYNELPLIPKNISVEDKKTVDKLADDFSKVFNGSEINTSALKKIIKKARNSHVDASIAPVLSKFAEKLEDFANRSSILVAQHLIHTLSKIPIVELERKDKEEHAFSTPEHGSKKARPPPLETESSSDSESESSSVFSEDSPVSESEIESFEVHSSHLANVAKEIANGKRLSHLENNELRKELKDLIENFSGEEFADLKIAIENAKIMLHTVITFPSAKYYQSLSQNLLILSEAMKNIVADLKGESSLRLDSPPSKGQKNAEPFSFETEDASDGLRLDSPLPKKEIPPDTQEKG